MSLTLYKKIIKTYKVFKNNKGLNVTKYTTIVAVGDRNGGLGVGKGVNSEQDMSLLKAVNNAKFSFLKIFLKNSTIPHPITGKSGKCIVSLFPLNKIINFSCGNYIRPMLDVMGLYRISSKIYGTGNFYNIIKAFLNALYNIESHIFSYNKKIFKCF
ncbi:hypothetical protein [Candidatus Nasuia deltocephalinicola]|uniref:hypothetical protein n=1 Tax=Candidatus Nasuia deltocephalincola TaxID=1160784 RepID=UPI00216AD4CE|nr:hypothetical protein [Candidatus Nasuia deltocephalinicola]